MGAVGDVRQIPTGPTLHAHFVVHGPAAHKGYGTGTIPQLILVNATTVRNGVPFDPTCVLQAGDHPAITHQSYIAYRWAKVEPEAHYELMTMNGVWLMGAPCQPSVLKRIQAGICNSPQTPYDIKTMFGCP
jgi:hypothetical protein